MYGEEGYDLISKVAGDTNFNYKLHKKKGTGWCK